MALKTYKPITPGLRQLVLVDRSALYKGTPVKTLTEGLQQVGRAQQSRPHHARFRKSGGHKRTYRIVDFKRRKLGHAGDRRADRVRSEPHGLHRAGQVRRTASSPTSWRRSGSRSATRSSPATRST